MEGTVIHIRDIFRHPYPLPAPPRVPRGDAIIISSNSAPEKNINSKRVRPDSDLAALIEAAGEEHNLVRRSNACGALKVLAAKDSNRAKLCRTEGLLDVLVKAGWDDAVDSDALDARTRAVTTLLYLSEPKDNRWIVAKHPLVLDVLVKVIQEDTGEARWRATSVLATLGKTAGNRGGMGRAELLATVLGNLMVAGQQRKDMELKNFWQGKDIVTCQVTKSFDYMDDEWLVKRATTGTETEGTGTTSLEDSMSQSAYGSDAHSGKERGDDDDDRDDDDDDNDNNDDGNHDDSGLNEDCGFDDEDSSMKGEEGVEMQISTLKKSNIEKAAEFLALSQLSACATLIHLSKDCANVLILCRNDELLHNIIFLAGVFDSPLHTRCIEILCNFTRFPSNNARLARMPEAIATLLLCGKSRIGEDRTWSVRAVQNLCSDASSKLVLSTGPVLSLLCAAAMRKDRVEEQRAAVGALMNLSTEPGSIVALMNSKAVVATLVHLAHSPETPGAARRIACDSLATIGMWLQTLASTGTMPAEVPFSPLPTHSPMGWMRWEDC